MLSGANTSGCDGNFTLVTKNLDGKKIYFEADFRNLAPGQSSDRILTVTNEGYMECKDYIGSPTTLWSHTPGVSDGQAKLAFDQRMWTESTW